MAPPMAATAASAGPAAARLVTRPRAPAMRSGPTAASTPASMTTATPEIAPSTSMRLRAMACSTPSSNTRSRAGASVSDQSAASLVSASVIRTSEGLEQLSAAPLHMRFDCSQGQSEHLGRLGVAELAPHAERHGRALVGRQAAQRPLEVETGVGAAAAGRRRRPQPFDAPSLPAARARKRERLVPGDGAEPGAERRRSAVAPEPRPGRQEGLLREVIGVGRVVQDAAQEAPHRLLVARYELAKRFLRAAAGGRDQVGVGARRVQLTRQKVAAIADSTPATVKAPAMIATIRKVSLFACA